MSSVQVLLTTLQDSGSWPNGSCRALLVELTSLCHHEEFKSVMLSTGLDVILNVAQDGCSDSIDVMLELLVTLALENRGAKVILAQKGAIQLTQSALEACLVKKPSKRRTRCMKLALELMDLLNSTEICQDPTQQRQLVEQIMRVLSNLPEDTNILLHATDVLGCMLEANASNIKTVSKVDGIQSLVHLLGLTSDKMDLKRSVCEVLLLMSEHPDTVQAMATDQTVWSLGQCLRAKAPGRDVEYVVVRLLLSLSLHAQVHGMIVHQNLTGLLFQVIERNCNILQVTRATCSILDGVAQFARECKLDISSFVSDVSCQGKILIQAATNHVHDSHLVSSIFHFFVNISYNPVDLPSLINSSAIEGLLSLYITSGGSGHLSVLADCIVQVISALSRSTIEAISFIDEDKTLPSLFLCLRANQENLKFASQVFALLSKHWKDQPKSAHSVTGFVGIAIDMIRRASNCWKNEMIEMYNFVREMLLSKDGIEVVQSCGGNMLLETLRCQQLAHETGIRNSASVNSSSLDDANSSGFSELEQIIRCVSTMLNTFTPEKMQSDGRESCTTTLTTTDQMVALRTGDKEYQEYVFNVLRKEQICLFKVFTTNNIEGYLPDSSRRDIDAYATERLTRRNEPDICLDHVRTDETICAQANAGSETNNPTQMESNLKKREEKVCEAECDANNEDVEVEPGEAKEGAEDANEDGNDDGSDDESDGDDKAVTAQEDLLDASNADAIYFSEKVSEEQIRSTCKRSTVLNYFQAHPQLNLIDSQNNSELQDAKYFFVDSLGIKHPKHPLKRLQHAKDIEIEDDEGLICDEPSFLEPFKASSPELTSSFVEKLTAKRNQFMVADVNSRAKIVYQNLIQYERQQTGSSNNNSDSVVLNVSPNSNSGVYPYDVPEMSQAFPNKNASLTFDSRFESGNLQRAIQIGEFEYDLILQRDVNTTGQTGHMQWFYFAVSNVQATSYRFNIVNLCKPDSLFNQGLQPVVYSVKDAKLKRKGWLRCGSDIYYFQNPFSRVQKSGGMDTSGNIDSASSTAACNATYYTLTFTLNFANADDTYLIAHSYPYTVTDNQLHMKQLYHRSGKRIHRIVRRTVLCQTLGGRDCDLLTISDFTASPAELKARRSVVLTSRVHPGETQSSWMMRGIIDFLLSDSDVARILRRLFVFRVIPLLNPDGVYYGNSRCALSACDLNRQWQFPSKIKHPTIFHAKQMIMKESMDRGVVFFCDIHGHSRKKNVFMYGCDTKKRPNPKARTFAKIYAAQETAKSYISFPDCSFKVSRDKETTARVVLANEAKLSWSFTLEASFSGANFGPLQGMHFNTKHLHNVGTSLCKALFDACISDKNVRERLGCLVNDYSFSLPGYAESYLKEAVNISSIPGASVANQELDITPRNTGAKKTSKPARRPSIRSVPPGEKSTTQPNAPRKLSHKGSRMFRQNSSAVVKNPHVETPSGVTVIVKCEEEFFGCPRPKLNGKKMRGKPKKAGRKSEATAETENTYMPALSGYSVQLQDLSSQARVRESSSADSSTSSASSSNLMTPSVPIPRNSGAIGPPSSSVRRSFTAAQPVDTPPLKATNAISFSFREATPLELPQSRDAAQMALPSPLIDVVSRSPKLKPNSIRFRGAGRQFAAVSPNKKANLKDAINPESMAPYLTYDQDLLNASALSIRHRSKTSANDYPAVQSRPLKFASPTSSTQYLSFPSVT